MLIVLLRVKGIEKTNPKVGQTALLKSLNNVLAILLFLSGFLRRPTMTVILFDKTNIVLAKKTTKTVKMTPKEPKTVPKNLQREKWQRI